MIEMSTMSSIPSFAVKNREKRAKCEKSVETGLTQENIIGVMLENEERCCLVKDIILSKKAEKKNHFYPGEALKTI